MDLSNQMFLGVPNVLQRFFRPHPVYLEGYVLRDYFMSLASRYHQTIFVQYRHYLNHGIGFIHHDRFLRYPISPRILVTRWIEVDGDSNVA